MKSPLTTPSSSHHLLPTPKAKEFPSTLPQMAVPSGPGGRSDPAAEPDPFEFFSSCSPGSLPPMCAATDVFLDGKIVPFGAPQPKRADIPSIVIRSPKSCAVSDGSDRRSRFWVIGGKKPEYRRLRKESNCDGNALPQTQVARQPPGWYLFVLGSLRVPAKTDMSDIRSRQRRRSAAAGACARSDGDVLRGAWRLLQTLSCTALESSTDVMPTLKTNGKGIKLAGAGRWASREEAQSTSRMYIKASN